MRTAQRIQRNRGAARFFIFVEVPFHGGSIVFEKIEHQQPFRRGLHLASIFGPGQRLQHFLVGRTHSRIPMTIEEFSIGGERTGVGR